jgi:hypothetical protein
VKLERSRRCGDHFGPLRHDISPQGLIEAKPTLANRGTGRRDGSDGRAQLYPLPVLLHDLEHRPTPRMPRFRFQIENGALSCGRGQFRRALRLLSRATGAAAEAHRSSALVVPRQGTFEGASRHSFYNWSTWRSVYDWLSGHSIYGWPSGHSIYGWPSGPTCSAK